MTTSSFGFGYTRNQMIAAVLRSMGKLGKTQTPSTADFANVSEAMNLMIKAWVNKGATLWKIQEQVVQMVNGVNLYPIGPTAGFLANAGVLITSPGLGGSAGTYALGIVDSGGGTGATGTYTIAGGIVTVINITAPGNSYVTPVLSFPSGGITGVVASITPTGLTSTRILRVLDYNNFIRNLVSGNSDTIQMLIGRNDYNALGNKTSTGVPNQFWYDPAYSPSNQNGNLHVYPTASITGQFEMHLMCHMTIDDTIQPTDTFDFPPEMLNAVKWGTCFDLMTEYGCDADTKKDIREKYQMYVPEAINFSVEEASTYFTYNSSRQGMGGR